MLLGTLALVGASKIVPRTHFSKGIKAFCYILELCQSFEKIASNILHI